MREVDALASQLALQLRYSRLAHPDSGAFLELVAKKFETALPACTQVSRRWGLLGGRVKEMVLSLGSVRYRIESERPSAYTVARQLVVHGIAVGTTEMLDAESWEEELCGDLSRYAASESLPAEIVEKLLGA